MIGKIVLAALVAGMLAGLALAGIQHLRLSPLILQGEVYEKAGETPDPVASAKPACVENMPGMRMCPDAGEAPAWAPAEGAQRTLFTSLASIIVGGGFGVLLTGLSLIAGVPITRQNGPIWGLCAFLAVAVAPAVGLPPEVPGMPVGDLLARQIWWVGTIAATGVAIYFIALRKEIWLKPIAILLIALPHIIGPPKIPDLPTLVTPHLAGAFATNSIAAAAIFWCLLGWLLGMAFEKLDLKVDAHG